MRSQLLALSAINLRDLRLQKNQKYEVELTATNY